MKFLLQGFLLTMASIAPIGVQNLFVINSALSLPPGRALVSAAAVILFDLSLTLSAFFGMASLMTRSELFRQAVLLLGSLAVLKIGLSLLKSRPGSLQGGQVHFSLKKILLRSFAVTWLNPQALIDASLFFGAFRASLPAEGVPLFLCGALAASPAWFTGLTLAMAFFRKQLGPRFLLRLNQVCGAVILIYGVRLMHLFVASL